AALLLAGCLLVLWRAGQAGRQAGAEASARAAELEARIGTLLQAQSETSGRIQAMQEHLGGRQAELNKTLSERLDGMTDRLNQSMGESSKNTHDNLKKLHERLAVIDAAQATIS